MRKWNYVSPGIPDEYFLRTEGVPMTKSEIRVLSLAKLRLFHQAVVYDIGAGSGSVAIECKLMLPAGRVLAIERNPQAIELIKNNAEQFDVDLELIAGSAPECLQGLPEADRIFLGGSGGQLPSILNGCDAKLKTGGWIVVNSVSLSTAPDAYNILKSKGYSVEATQVNIAISSQRGNSELWQARNPVTIIAAQKRGE